MKIKKLISLSIVAISACFALPTAASAQKPTGKIIKSGNVYILDGVKLSSQDEKQLLELLHKNSAAGQLTHVSNRSLKSYGSKNMMQLNAEQVKIVRNIKPNATATQTEAGDQAKSKESAPWVGHRHFSTVLTCPDFSPFDRNLLEQIAIIKLLSNYAVNQ